MKYIGVFDSGFGGLTILRGIKKKMPYYNYIYLGDNARAPYGSRSPDLVFEFTRQAVDFLFKNKCEIVILACNTASSEALRKIQQEYLPQNYPDKKVLGVLIPASEEAVVKTINKRIGVIATEGTVKSRAFVREIKKLEPEAKVFQVACPLLVPLVEAGKQNSKLADLMLGDYLKPLLKKRIDVLILGCTHYGLLEKKIRQIIGPKIKIISEAPVVADKLKDYLKRHKDIEEKIGRDGKIIFYSTDLSDKFQKLGSKFFGQKIKNYIAHL